MKESKNLKNLNKDFSETKNLLAKTAISLKLFYYFFQRPLAHLIIKQKLKLELKGDCVFDKINRFLLNEGGMFKNYAYKICDGFHPIKNSTILVPGAGYGKNLFQLASFRPKLIVAFDLYEYQEEWKFITEKILKEFGVEVLFFKGGFGSIPKIYENQFDFIISDAVLEHIRDFLGFMKSSKKFLKSNGIFYASFGPIWCGPGGDHLDWGKDKLFDHLLLNEEEYQEKFRETFKNYSISDSCEGYFLVKEKLFSRLKVEEYLDILNRTEFKELLLWAKISSSAMNLFRNNQNLHQILNVKGIPKFDRFCSGLYLWSRLK